MDKALVNDEVLVLAEVLESRQLAMQGKDHALMTPKEASKRCK